jgi:VCBS repeat-containing protein
MLEITTGNKSSACFYTLKQAQGLYSLLTILDRIGAWSYVLRHIHDYILQGDQIDVAILVNEEQISVLRCIMIHE